MPFTAQELAEITNSAINFHMEKGRVFANNIQSKPMVAAFDETAGTFPGGKGQVDLRVKSGQGGGSLTGYTHDDQVSYYNPTGTKTVAYTWKEMFIGMGITHTELKHDGITVNETGANQTTSPKSQREMTMLANLLEEKIAAMAEDYAVSWNNLLHGDGTSDTKALAGIRSFILDNPALGSTGGMNRTTINWWRNRAATAAAASASTGPAAVTSAVANGGALVQFLQKEYRQLQRYVNGSARHRCFAGSDFIDALERELRANGSYSDTGWRNRGSVNAGMNTMSGVPFLSWNITYDPTLDDLDLSKRCYVIDMNAIKLHYMAGEKMKRSSPPRPHDRFVMYRAMTTTAVMTARQLNTSAVYDIA